jgi:exodeoxyribonuclease-3
MRFATWNVNSLKVRLPRVEEFLSYAEVDVLCLQETKLSDKTFPALTFSGLGYESVHFGQGQWNGVAILSRVGLEDPTFGFGDKFVDPYEGDARVLGAVAGGIRFVSLYVPNGREVPSEFYDRKLQWFGVLHDWVAAHHAPQDPLVLIGDFNVAPADRDVWDPKAFVGSTHVTDPERAAVRTLEDWGMQDLFRRVYPDAERLYTYWDYRAGDFHQHRGMRIDLALGTAPVAERVTWSVVDRNARKGQQPSDHAPLIVDLSNG